MAWLFFFFAQLFLFFPPALYEVGEASEKEKNSSHACVYARVVEINNSLELFFLL